MKLLQNRLLLLLCAVIAISGCGAGLRALQTGDTYMEMRGKFPPITAGNGRFIIYMEERTHIPGEGAMFTSSAGGIDFVTVDRLVYRYGGKSFIFADAPIGKHLLTTSEIFKAQVFGSNTFNYGKNRFEVAVIEGETKFIKIDYNDLTMKEVEQQVAEQELASLPMYEKETNVRLKKLE